MTLHTPWIEVQFNSDQIELNVCLFQKKETSSLWIQFKYIDWILNQIEFQFQFN
jgi:hypothetical protein